MTAATGKSTMEIFAMLSRDTGMAINPEGRSAMSLPRTFSRAAFGRWGMMSRGFSYQAAVLASEVLALLRPPAAS